MQRTKIEYLTHVWNPIAMRCDRVSSGCDNCWHIRMAKRLAGNMSFQKDVRDAYRGLGPVLKGLDSPFKLRKPAVIGVQFMGDMFHKSIPFECIAAIFGAIAANPRHQFVVLTKRVDRAAEFYRWVVEQDLYAAGIDLVHGSIACAYELLRQAGPEMDDNIYKRGVAPDAPWPLENLILGTSVEDQQTADERILKLINIPAEKRFVSFEPALEEVDFAFIGTVPKDDEQRNRRLNRLIYTRDSYVFDHIDLLVAGAETGPGARPAELDWFRSAREQCAAAGVPFFLKQVNAKGDRELDGIKHEEWINE